MTTIDLQPLAGIPSLDLEQYTGLWAVDEMRFGAMLDQIGKMDLAAHVATGSQQAGARTERQEQGNATIQIIDIRGTMTKRGSSLSDAGSTIRLRQAVREAVASKEIDGIVLRIDSPGGTVAGTADLANEVANAANQKPVWAFVDDVTASAAYWVASQASKIVANNATAVVGSIGTFMALYDVSGAAAMSGIKAVVIRSGQFKGAGFPGAEISDDQKQIWQESVDTTQAQFTAGVASGRNMSVPQAEVLANGRTWLAEEAKSLNLIDGIGSFDQFLSDMAAEIMQRNSNQRSSRMSEDKTTPQPATYAEIKAACVGADRDFIGSQVEAEATVDAARGAWMSALQEKADVAEAAKAEAEKKEAEAKAEAEKAKAGKPGVEMLGSGGKADDNSGDPIADFRAAVEEKQKLNMTKADATRAVISEKPELHQAYVEAYNDQVRS